MSATWRALPAWPYPPRKKASNVFNSTWSQALELLELEVGRVAGSDLVIGIVCLPDQISYSGVPKGGSRIKVSHPGVEVSFEKAGGRLAFHTDAFDFLQWNIRAIALGLQALRAVDRYGITSAAEQYAGFAMLADGRANVERGRALATEAGSVTAALKKHHPDHGGDARAFQDVKAYRDLVKG